MAAAENLPGCLLCGSLEPKRLFELAQAVVRCRGCGLVYGVGAQAEPATRYEEPYYHGLVYSDYLADRPAIHRNARRALRELESLTLGRSLLDVGCAAGFFLEAARDRGWAVEGVEVSEYMATHAREVLGLDVYRGSVIDLPDGQPRFDAVTLWDVIEHLDRPDIALRKIRSLLKPNGVIAISTGDHASLIRKLTGRRWRLFADPTHRFFFDGRTLGRLLESTGFRIVSRSHRGKWVSLSMAIKQAPLPLSPRLRAVLERRTRNLFLYANLWDVITVLATP